MSFPVTNKHEEYATYNIRYLRISERKVLPLILYVRPENTGWFNEVLFQEVLAALQKVIPKNLSKERKKKTSDKNVYRGTNLQMAYYFKPTETRHSILLKDKNYVFSSEESPDGDEDEDEEEKKPVLNITYQGFSIFRKTLVIIVEPLEGIIEFGSNVKVASSMSIDDYMGQQDYSSDVDRSDDRSTDQTITID
ncbi:15532_t:CDS:2 [Acaulospora colombiana]|uniref:15532_t:CDS:1 n=1 Tax=Acaulospora colombiana TaxID=27376 RepID=A0ACA9KVG4_9GLOM|nr:15532_t:CDS:2 [Acaulospora colombiana]